MKRMMMAMGIGLGMAIGVMAEGQPAVGAAVPAGAKPEVSAPADEAADQKIQALLSEEMTLRQEVRELNRKMQGFAEEMGTNNAALAKAHQEWRKAQDRADELKAELQTAVENSADFKAMKARRDAADARLNEIRPQLREVFKDRGMRNRPMRNRPRVQETPVPATATEPAKGQE